MSARQTGARTRGFSSRARRRGFGRITIVGARRQQELRRLAGHRVQKRRPGQTNKRDWAVHARQAMISALLHPFVWRFIATGRSAVLIVARHGRNGVIGSVLRERRRERQRAERQTEHRREQRTHGMCIACEREKVIDQSAVGSAALVKTSQPK